MIQSNYLVWDVSPEIFNIGGFAPRWYGLCFALGIFLGYQIMRKFFLEARRSEEELNAGFVLFVFGTIVGARVGHCLFYEPEYYLSKPWKILYIWEGGLASHGGTIGIFACMIYYTNKYKIPFFWLADHLAVAIALGIPFIRIGNFFNSEIYGKATDLPWAVIFKRAAENPSDMIPRHPAQLYEALCYFVIFFGLSAYYRVSKGVFPAGRLVGLLLIGVFGSRFFIEFLKENQVSFENDMVLNMGQLLSIPMMILGLMFAVGIQKIVKLPEAVK
jgi:phosphatidylglycerol:prolipoprotein diacylglycerol transferase